MEQADQLSDRALLAIGPALVLALIASLGHLGNPLNAPKAISNLGSSWLSREILLVVLFTVVGGVFAIMQWRKIATFTVRNFVALLAALIGLALVYSMSQVYMLEAQPAWNTLATPILFFATTFLLGALAMGAAFVANYAYIQRKNPGCADQQCILLRDSLRGIAIAAIVLLGIELIVVPLQTAYLASAPSAAAAASAQMMYANYGIIFALRLALVFLGAGILAVFVYRSALSVGREKWMGNLAYFAFALVLVGEVLGRFLFYATHVKIGI
jgi:anaerobic dimethyl sulfoxide reductase subunit C (anchor subunit)